MKKDANRQAMPIIAAFVDEIRAQGVTVKVLYASENGRTVGTKPPEFEPAPDPYRGMKRCDAFVLRGA